MFSDGLDGIESALSDVGILLVGKLLLEGLNGPAEKIVSAEFSEGEMRPMPPPPNSRTRRDRNLLAD